ncbi:hypothetical protein DQ04_14421000 [Trypanosoma grayi]|uniref:hypothetical protein n=1 Tax=Trypanosoma grayi TaxID=71804 RepID=UPI0004F422EF|nr:hypothetical protein DQ04_14421000 [Trypanosoma grayi]KEG06359.1 hypothetical protein DQ04_14421000 [Trypanosoma grayi]
MGTACAKGGANSAVAHTQGGERGHGRGRGGGNNCRRSGVTRAGTQDGPSAQRDDALHMVSAHNTGETPTFEQDDALSIPSVRSTKVRAPTAPALSQPQTNAMRLGLLRATTKRVVNAGNLAATNPRETTTLSIKEWLERPQAEDAFTSRRYSATAAAAATTSAAAAAVADATHFRADESSTADDDYTSTTTTENFMERSEVCPSLENSMKDDSAYLCPSSVNLSFGSSPAKATSCGPSRLPHSPVRGTGEGTKGALASCSNDVKACEDTGAAAARVANGVTGRLLPLHLVPALVTGATSSAGDERVRQQQHQQFQEKYISQEAYLVSAEISARDRFGNVEKNTQDAILPSYVEKQRRPPQPHVESERVEVEGDADEVPTPNALSVSTSKRAGLAVPDDANDDLSLHTATEMSQYMGIGAVGGVVEKDTGVEYEMPSQITSMDDERRCCSPINPPPATDAPLQEGTSNSFPSGAPHAFAAAAPPSTLSREQPAADDASNRDTFDNSKRKACESGPIGTSKCDERSETNVSLPVSIAAKSDSGEIVGVLAKCVDPWLVLPLPSPRLTSCEGLVETPRTMRKEIPEVHITTQQGEQQKKHQKEQLLSDLPPTTSHGTEESSVSAHDASSQRKVASRRSGLLPPPPVDDDGDDDDDGAIKESRAGSSGSWQRSTSSPQPQHPTHVLPMPSGRRLYSPAVESAAATNLTLSSAGSMVTTSSLAATSVRSSHHLCWWCNEPYKWREVCVVAHQTHTAMQQQRRREKRVKKKAQELLRCGRIQEAMIELREAGVI